MNAQAVQSRCSQAPQGTDRPNSTKTGRSKKTTDRLLDVLVARVFDAHQKAVEHEAGHERGQNAAGADQMHPGHGRQGEGH